MSVRFVSHLDHAQDTVRRASRAAVTAVAKDAAKAARRRIARDTGESAESIRGEAVSDTRATVGASPEQARIIEYVRGGRDRWLGPALEAAEARASEVGTAAARRAASGSFRRYLTGR